MSKIIDLEDLEKESRRLFAEDGFLYIFLGALLLLVSISFAVPALTGLVGFSAFLIFPVEALRRRVTYPRLGYAHFAAPPGFVRGILGFIAATVVALSVIAFAGGGRFQSYLPLAFSIVFALAYYFGATMHGTGLRDWLLIGLTLAAGLFASWRFEDWHDGASVLFGFLGVVLLLIGLIKLVRFLRKYPLLPEVDAS
jgi:hypothetical protein